MGLRDSSRYRPRKQKKNKTIGKKGDPNSLVCGCDEKNNVVTGYVEVLVQGENDSRGMIIQGGIGEKEAGWRGVWHTALDTVGSLSLGG